METDKLMPEHIVAEQAVIHPALDWRDNTLFMGVMLAEGRRGVLTSQGRILSLSELPYPVCDRSQHFMRTPVSENVARTIRERYGTQNRPDGRPDVHGRLAAYYRRFIVFPEPWWPDLLALWTLGTYLYPVFNTYPYLRITSPEPGCGKSLLGEIISKLSFNGELMVSPTEANVFRMAESDRGSQIWDEFENQHEADRSRLKTMNGVLLNGYRAGGSVPRQERIGRNFKTVRFHVFVPRVLIGLSELPTLVQQRTIELALHRRTLEEDVASYFSHEQEREEQDLRETCAIFALNYCQSVSRNYRDRDLAKRLMNQLSQTGRLPEDLLLPLLAVCASPSPEENPVPDRVGQFLMTIAPPLAQAWNGASQSTWPLLGEVLTVLEDRPDGLEPQQLANELEKRTGTQMSVEKLARSLKKHDIRSKKHRGRRKILLSQNQIDQVRARYGIEEPTYVPTVRGQ